MGLSRAKAEEPEMNISVSTERWTSSMIWLHWALCLAFSMSVNSRPVRAMSSRVPTAAMSSMRAVSSSAATRPRSCRSEEHTSELQSLMRISYAVFCLKKKKHKKVKEYVKNTHEEYN